MIEQGQVRLQRAVESQHKIDEIYQNTQDLLAQYQAKLESVDSLTIYNQLLKSQLDNQQQEILTLESSIQQAAVIERQIAPLLVKMIDSLALFIKADVPFLQQERQQRITDLRAMLPRSDVSAAEKSRRVFEAYQIEIEYGRTLETYTSRLALDDQSHDADFLRVGRIALIFQLIGQDRAGYWDVTQKRWQSDDSRSFKRFVEQGIKVANKETAPEMINIPLILTDRKS